MREGGNSETLAVVDPVLTILGDCCRSYGFTFWAAYMDQSSIVVNGLAIVCIFSLLGLCFGHSFACERLTNSEKAQICISTSQRLSPSSAVSVRSS